MTFAEGAWEVRSRSEKEADQVERIRFHEYQVSRLLLGTVQFGVVYGLVNRTGKPSFRSIVEMLAKAFENGVNALDTARFYGDSETVLGRALGELGLKDQVFLCTKVTSLQGRIDPKIESPDRAIRESVVESARELGVDTIPLVLFHDPNDLQYLDGLLAQKAQGRCAHVGVSLYTPEQALTALATPGVEAIQLPTNILDRRFAESGVFGEARRRGVAIFVRSVYLKGLLVIPEEEIHPGLEAVLPVRQKFDEIAAELGISLAEFALRFVYSVPEVSGVVVGMERPAQLESNLRMLRRGVFPEALVRDVQGQQPHLGDEILNPGMWPPELVEPPEAYQV